MARVSVDSSDLRSLVADFTRAPMRAVLAARPVVKRGANNIKNQLREEMSASTHFRGIASSISYDMFDGGLGADIGAVTGPGKLPGDLAHFAYFGNGGRGGSVPDPRFALEAEAPRFEKALADVLEGLVR